MGKERLDLILVQRGLVPSRSRAQARILAGEVIVNDHRIDKAGTRVPEDAEIRLKGDDLPYVGRGGLKLAGALERWPMALDGVIGLDVGASTGGFTDVLLQAGAAKVYAVDVGHNQLAWKLRQDPRVVNMEKTHIEHLEPGSLQPAPSIGVVDVSFISLRRVLPAMCPHLRGPGRLYALVKPQFEVGRDQVGKGGIVRDPALRKEALTTIQAVGAGLGLTERGWMESPITGTDGNVEFLICWELEGLAP